MIGGPAFSAKNAIPAGARLVPDPPSRGGTVPCCAERPPLCATSWGQLRLAGWVWSCLSITGDVGTCRGLAVPGELQGARGAAVCHRGAAALGFGGSGPQKREQVPACLRRACGGTADAQVWPCRRGSRCFANALAAPGSGGLVGVLVTRVAVCFRSPSWHRCAAVGLLKSGFALEGLSAPLDFMWISFFLRHGFANGAPISLIAQRTTPEDTLTALQGSCNCRFSVGLDE